MSRNLGQPNCAFCGGTIRCLEAARPIEAKEASVYYDEYQGMLVAKAKCETCEAPYLAWLDGRPRRGPSKHPDPNPAERVRDLSHYHAFNDEPSTKDFPKYKVVSTQSLRPWPRCRFCDAPCDVRGMDESGWEGACSAYCEASRAVVSPTRYDRIDHEEAKLDSLGRLAEIVAQLKTSQKELRPGEKVHFSMLAVDKDGGRILCRFEADEFLEDLSALLPR